MLPFLWSFKTPRVGKKHLTKPKRNGGLSFPNFIMYYWACAFISFNFYSKTSDPIPSWLTIEQEDCHPYYPTAIVLSPIPLTKSLYGHNPVIHNLIRIWKQIKSHFAFKSISISLPISKNPSFAPSNLDLTFYDWDRMGIHCIRDLYIQGTFATFIHLQNKFKLHTNNFF